MVQHFKVSKQDDICMVPASQSAFAQVAAGRQAPSRALIQVVGRGAKTRKRRQTQFLFDINGFSRTPRNIVLTATFISSLDTFIHSFFLPNCYKTDPNPPIS